MFKIILSTMRRPFALIVALLLITPLLMALAAGTASAKDLVAVPLDQRVEVTPGMYAHLIQLTISDTSYGASFADDLDNVLFPVLVYNYENNGTVAQTGHLHVRFTDDHGQTYDGRDAGTMAQIQPDSISSIDFIEINIPKDRKITELTVIMGFKEQTIPIDYPDMPAPTPAPTSNATPSASPTGTICISTMLLPLTLIGVAWAGTRMARK
jgi:hypothetical protein